MIFGRLDVWVVVFDGLLIVVGFIMFVIFLINGFLYSFMVKDMVVRVNSNGFVRILWLFFVVCFVVEISDKILGIDVKNLMDVN